MKARALFIPWLIGAVSTAIVGAAAWNLASEAHTAAERQETEAVATTETDVPELVIIPELHVIETNDATEHYPDAP